MSTHKPARESVKQGEAPETPEPHALSPAQQPESLSNEGRRLKHQRRTKPEEPPETPEPRAFPPARRLESLSREGAAQDSVPSRMSTPIPAREPVKQGEAPETLEPRAFAPARRPEGLTSEGRLPKTAKPHACTLTYQSVSLSGEGRRLYTKTCVCQDKHPKQQSLTQARGSAQDSSQARLHGRLVAVLQNLLTAWERPLLFRRSRSSSLAT